MHALEDSFRVPYAGPLSPDDGARVVELPLRRKRSNVLPRRKETFTLDLFDMPSVDVGADSVFCISDLHWDPMPSVLGIAEETAKLAALNDALELQLRQNPGQLSVLLNGDNFEVGFLRKGISLDQRIAELCEEAREVDASRFALEFGRFVDLLNQANRVIVTNGNHELGEESLQKRAMDKIGAEIFKDGVIVKRGDKNVWFEHGHRSYHDWDMSMFPGATLELLQNSFKLFDLIPLGKKPLGFSQLSYAKWYVRMMLFFKGVDYLTEKQEHVNENFREWARIICETRGDIERLVFGHSHLPEQGENLTVLDAARDGVVPYAIWDDSGWRFMQERYEAKNLLSIAARNLSRAREGVIAMRDLVRRRVERGMARTT